MTSFIKFDKRQTESNDRRQNGHASLLI